MTVNRWTIAALVAPAIIISAKSATCFFTTTTTTALSSRGHRRPPHLSHTCDFTPPATTRPPSTSSSSTSPPSTTTRPPPGDVSSFAMSYDDDENILLSEATRTLQRHDESQRTFVVSDGSQGMGGGHSAFRHIQSLDPDARSALRDAVRTLTKMAITERESDSSKGRVMMGYCASNVPEALGGLKSWVTELDLPRGMLHGMDLDGVPIPVEDFGPVYVKYSTGGAMTFGEMRRSGRGFDALWRPGDALLETYDGDFRGVYLNVELGDGAFRQFGLLPTDLFMVEEEW